MGLGTSITKLLSGAGSTKKSGASYLSKVNTSNRWEGELESIYDQIANREKFSYDMNEDAFYKQYAQQYEQQAKLAMQDTVGQASALTGGYANSYAATAGQAMYNQQMQGLNDKAIDLYNLALQTYNSEGDRLMGIYNMTATNYGLDQDRINSEISQAQWNAEFDENQRQYEENMAFEYARAAAQDAQWAAELAADNSQFYASLAFDKSRAAAQDAQWAQEFAYSKERDAASDAQWQQTFDYNAEQDKIANDRWAQEFAYQKQRDAVSDDQYAKELAYKYASLSRSDDEFEQNMAYKYAQLDEEKRQFNIENDVKDDENAAGSYFTDKEFTTYKSNLDRMTDDRRRKYIYESYAVNGSLSEAQYEELISRYKLR